MAFVMARGYSYTSYSWRHVQSDHFVISYNERTQAFAQEALSIAEETYGSLTQYFGSPPRIGKINIVLSDDVDSRMGRRPLEIPWSR